MLTKDLQSIVYMAPKNPIKNMDLPQVTQLEDRAFAGCTNLETISLPNVTEIDYSAFDGCTNLETISLPNATKIGNAGFRSCTNLETISLPNVTYIGNEAFDNCTNLETISLPNATRIGNEAFDNCARLKEVRISDRGTQLTIGAKAFNKCRRLTGLLVDGSYENLWPKLQVDETAMDPLTHVRLMFPITYDANGGTDAPAAERKVLGDDLTLTTREPRRSGYVFAGWSTTVNGTVNYQPGDRYTADESATLYAVWQKAAENYTLHYSTDQGVPVPASQTAAGGTQVKLSTVVPRKSGYVFLGWADRKGGTPAYRAGDAYTLQQNTTLYAVWQAQEPAPEVHVYRTKVQPATWSADGRSYEVCDQCGAVRNTRVIAKTKTASLSAVNYTYEGFINDLADGKVKDVTISQNQEIPTGKITVKLSDDSKKNAYVNDVEAVEAAIMAYNKTAKDDAVVTYKQGDVQRDSVFLTTILPFIIVAAVIIFIFVFMNRQAAAGGGSNSKMMNFGKSRAKMMDPRAVKVTFKQVAGLSEEKEELEEIVDFLKNPKKYTDLGARIPKGVILVGPPGTGKTLLAKAVAGEAGVPFFSISGSDFVEMFVGVGASRVRDLFEEAKKNSPCIVFIDEIDAVARRRGTGMGGGHDEREQTLNQMLVEMDGFGVNAGIIVMAATNRVDILDPAILRPGRFDRKVVVGRPDVKGREEILNVHVKGKPIGDDVDLKTIAQTTAGFTGADLENLMNEAAILAAKKNEAYITQADIDKSFVKVGIGAEKKSKVISDKEKKITAYHEAGHAILFHVLPDVGPVHTISIIPTGTGAAGYTMPLPEKDEMFNTKGKMLQEIVVGLGGRVAEELIFDDVTTGASQDIKQATALARAMVTKYGFSDKVGLVNYGSDEDEVFIGRDLAHTRSYGENVATVIDEEVKGIIDECYAKARKIINDNRDVLDACAKLLLDKEKVTREEFEALFDKPEILI